jgi:hypothetical protein
MSQYEIYITPRARRVHQRNKGLTSKNEDQSDEAKPGATAMSAQPKPHVSEDAYLAFERASMTKHEYYHGQIYAMTGASEPHHVIAANTIASLHNQLRRTSCRVCPSDMRVKVQQTGLDTTASTQCPYRSANSSVMMARRCFP